MRKTLTTLAALAALTLAALPASAQTAVVEEPNQATITNTGDEPVTYRVQVYEGRVDMVLAPGESYMFTTRGLGGHWAVWQNPVDYFDNGELVANGVFQDVWVDHGEGAVLEPNPDFGEEEEPVADAPEVEAPVEPEFIFDPEAFVAFMASQPGVWGA